MLADFSRVAALPSVKYYRCFIVANLIADLPEVLPEIGQEEHVSGLRPRRRALRLLGARLLLRPSRYRAAARGQLQSETAEHGPSVSILLMTVVLSQNMNAALQ